MSEIKPCPFDSPEIRETLTFIMRQQKRTIEKLISRDIDKDKKINSLEAERSAVLDEVIGKIEGRLFITPDVNAEAICELEWIK